MIYVNDFPINISIFPDNTSQVWKVKQIKEMGKDRYALIRWDYSHEGEFLQLAQLKDLLDINDISSHLYINYLPYGRQDKEISNESTFALRSFSKLLNSLNFEFIIIMDPHSSIATDLIKNAHAIYPNDAVLFTSIKLKTNLFFYPDSGAQRKYSDMYNVRNEYYGFASKVRDQLTGNIVSLTLFGDDIEGKNVLIIDDICDGGMTFKLLAKELLTNGAKEVNLFVTHGLFSQGLRTLRESGIKRIFTQDGEVFEINGQITHKGF